MSIDQDGNGLLAFAGGKVALVTLGPQNGSPTGPLQIGDLTRADLQPVQGTEGVRRALVAAGPDGFVASWDAGSTAGIDATKGGLRLVRLALDGTRVWDVPVADCQFCAPEHLLAVAGQFILAGKEVYAWADGRHVGHLPLDKEPSPVWWAQRSWTPSSTLVAAAGGEDQVTYLDLAKLSVSSPVNVFTTPVNISSEGWVVHQVPATPGGSEMSALAGDGPDGKHWRTDVSAARPAMTGASTGGAVAGVTATGDRLYLSTNERTVVVLDIATGKQLQVIPLDNNTTFIGSVPGAIVVDDAEGHVVRWIY